MPIEPIKRGKLSDEIADQIKKNILSKEWLPGDKLPSENDLAKIFNVSRISIRAAVSNLCALGILKSIHGEGTFVGELNGQAAIISLIPFIAIDKTQLIDIYEFRKILEIGAVKLAAIHITEQQLGKIEENMDYLKAVHMNPEEFVKADFEFHNLLTKAAANELLCKVNNSVREMILNAMQNNRNMFGSYGGLKYHPLILDAIKKHDSKTAAEIMEQHMDASIRKIRESV